MVRDCNLVLGMGRECSRQVLKLYTCLSMGRINQTFVFYPGLFAHGSIVKDTSPLGQICKSPAPGISTSVHYNFSDKLQEHNFSN